MYSKKIVGNKGEEIAEKYLKKKGYKILGKNIKQRFDEIDIIAKEKTGIIVFAEVKTVKCLPANIEHQITPEENITKAKLKKLKRGAMSWVGENEKKVSEAGWRIDLVAICYEDLTKIEKNCNIEHYENIVA